MNAASHCCDSSMLGVPNLEASERFLLWAVRTWSAHHMDLRDVWLNLDVAFAQAGIRAALSPFDRMMNVLFRGLQRWPDIRCVRCPQLGADETRMLAALSDLQRHDLESARLRLTQFATRTAARVACEFATVVVEVATHAGLQFNRLRCGEATAHFEPLVLGKNSDAIGGIH